MASPQDFHDEPVACNCKNLCNRVGEVGKRGVCPCFSRGGYCSFLCKCGTTKQCCSNRPREEDRLVYGLEHSTHLLDGNGDDEEPAMISFIEDDEPFVLQNLSTNLDLSLQTIAEDFVEAEASAAKNKKGSKRKATNSSGNVVKKRVTQTKAKKGPGRQCKKSSTVARAPPEPVDIAVEIKPILLQITTDELHSFVITALRLHPTLRAQLPGATGGTPVPGPPGPPNQPPPGWCHCGNCREMPTPEEQLCCRRTDGQCITVLSRNIMNTVVLNLDVLQVAIQNRNDMLVLDEEPNNQALRNMAYRQYVLWKCGRLGAGNRVVIASCVVWLVRDAYPSPNGIYIGFKPARLQ